MKKNKADKLEVLPELEEQKIQLEAQAKEIRMLKEELQSSKKIILMQSRYAAMGEIISMIAHQWRQPLNVVGLAIANIETTKALGISNEKIVDDNIATIAQNITFMSDTIDDFRDYFKSDVPKELISVDEIISSLLKIIGTVLDKNGISLEIDNSSKTALLIHKNSLLQVLLNILGNAKEALISKRVAHAKIRLIVSETPDLLTLKVCDNAGGIKDNLLDKIGENAFQSEKLNGTGLGLYISKIIIEKHFGGVLSWYNEPKGACFEINLNKVK